MSRQSARIVLTRGERARVKLLIQATAKHGADATLDALPDLHPDSHAAVIAYLASLAAERLAGFTGADE